MFAIIMLADFLQYIVSNAPLQEEAKLTTARITTTTEVGDHRRGVNAFTLFLRATSVFSGSPFRPFLLDLRSTAIVRILVAEPQVARG